MPADARTGGGDYDRPAMKVTLLQYAAVAAAGACGAVLRVALAAAFSGVQTRFPLGIFLVNVSGSFLLGWFATYASVGQVSETSRLAIGAGFVGAYTTFSTLMFDTARLTDEGAGWMATFNLIGSVVFGLLAVRLGMLAAGRA